MLQADEPGCAPAGLRFDEDLHLVDGEPDVDGDYVEEDHLSISVENLLAFLDEPPEGSATPKAAAVSPLRISSNGPPESILIPNDVDIENDAWYQDVSPESTAVAAPEPEGYESLQWAPLNYMEMSYDREVATGPGYLFKSPETSSNYIDAYNQDGYDVDLYNSTSNGNNFFNGKSLGLSTDWLRLSLSDNDTHDSAGVTGYPLSITERDQKSFSENVECGTLPHETTAEDCNDFTEYTTYTNNILMERGGEESGKTSAEPSIQVKFEPTLNADSPSSDVPEDESKGSYLLDDYHFLAHGKFSSDEAYESRILDGNAYMAPLTELRIAPDSACTNMPLASKMKSVATGITMEASKNYFISRDSGGEGCNGLFEESICLQPSLSDDMEITAIPNDERNGQLCAFQSFPTKTEAIRGRQEEDLSVSYPDIPIIDLDACSPDENCHKVMSVKYASSLESSSIFRNGMMTPIKKKSDFKNVIQSNPFQKDRSEGFVPPTYHQCHHSVDEVIQRNTLQGKIMAKDYNTHMMDNIQIFPTRIEEVSVWPKARDEQLTFQMALQDLSQPKTEASPPDGVLAVPLLRHQRIALSWMVQKETSNLNCSGGILADDQGLGKTVSTIALILSERSPLSKSGEAIKQVEIETLSLDDDEVVHLNGNSDKKRMKSMISDSSITPSVKGRPAAGTLVVCPTSVLRQWADELQSKVTSKGNLSFLVYHGSNRTKDPNELTKYDVVLTTYSIVSMEVPKQLSSDKDDEEKVKSDGPDSTGSSTNRKRKNPGSKSKRSTVDKALIESSTRPLARVAWFRVILDEAQTIKNHRTQVAGACCGLRAKRRWCLSGTPIQNAIDDLYSYFRFLRYDPYASYKSFCANIKIPINKHPNTGYKKLQAVLKTIMLRRTKGTLLDGQPVIALPPKTVTLKKVDFSSGERSFYCRLEAESREQFKVYADAGTVKQNYVNILLMLLRLRQACDHPVLVQGYDSNSIWNSSVESAKRLPGDKRLELLNCLEASQAICTICNDPPEDAVVAICGHVFCNQCVCEHFTVDDKHCPSPQCKVKLDANSVFPRASLESSIADLHGDDIHSGSCIDQDMSEPYKDLLSSDSSKIKAAIEILQSLPRLRDNPFNNSPNHDDAEQLTETTHEKDPVMDDTGQPNLKKCFNSHRSEKAIVFSQWTRMLDLLEARLKSSYIQYRRLDGTMSVAARDKAVKDFNTLPEVTVMIMSLKAASLGLNMVAACHVVLLDLWWNPTTEDQAIDRAHRIGQTRPVTVSRLTVKDTVEDRILALQEKKREMVASAFGEDENGSRQSRLTVEDLNYLFMA